MNVRFWRKADIRGMSRALPIYATVRATMAEETKKMSKEQKSNREKKKPKQDKSAKAAATGSAYAQAFKAKKK